MASDEIYWECPYCKNRHNKQQLLDQVDYQTIFYPTVRTENPPLPPLIAGFCSCDNYPDTGGRRLANGTKTTAA